MKILSSTYQLYACGKIPIRVLILEKNLHFSREPLILPIPGRSGIFAVSAVFTFSGADTCLSRASAGENPTIRATIE
jgi:hypothetical protein